VSLGDGRRSLDQQVLQVHAGVAELVVGKFLVDERVGLDKVRQVRLLQDPGGLGRNASGFRAKQLKAVPFLVALCDRSWLQACCSGFLRDG